MKGWRRIVVVTVVAALGVSVSNAVFAQMTAEDINSYFVCLRNSPFSDAWSKNKNCCRTNNGTWVEILDENGQITSGFCLDIPDSEADYIGLPPLTADTTRVTSTTGVSGTYADTSPTPTPTSGTTTTTTSGTYAR
jgi:hypothetical protein